MRQGKVTREYVTAHTEGDWHFLAFVAHDGQRILGSYKTRKEAEDAKNSIELPDWPKPNQFPEGGWH